MLNPTIFASDSIILETILSFCDSKSKLCFLWVLFNENINIVFLLKKFWSDIIHGLSIWTLIELEVLCRFITSKRTFLDVKYGFNDEIIRRRLRSFNAIFTIKTKLELILMEHFPEVCVNERKSECVNEFVIHINFFGRKDVSCIRLLNFKEKHLDQYIFNNRFFNWRYRATFLNLDKNYFFTSTPVNLPITYHIREIYRKIIQNSIQSHLNEDEIIRHRTKHFTDDILCYKIWSFPYFHPLISRRDISCDSSICCYNSESKNGFCYDLRESTKQYSDCQKRSIFNNVNITFSL